MVSPDPTASQGAQQTLSRDGNRHGLTPTIVNMTSTSSYTGLKKALEMAPEAVTAEVRAAGLVGRGGAAFLTCVKWEGAAQAPGAEFFEHAFPLAACALTLPTPLF